MARASEHNLALQPGVRITVSATQLTGGAARDPQVLLNDTIPHLNGALLEAYNRSSTYDTYDGQNSASGPDWYALTFLAPVTCNTVEMSMGLAYRDGGWWRSLAVEVCDADGRWRAVEPVTITPPYHFADERGERRPFETYALTFGDITACGVRIIGVAGGLAQFTSLSRLAVYRRDLTCWNPDDLPVTPMPALFRILPPRTIWDVSEGLMKLTGLAILFPLMEYYLDEPRYHQFWQRMRRNYEGEPELWFVLGEAVGWTTWDDTIARALHGREQPGAHVQLLFDGLMGMAVAPVVVGQQHVGEVATSLVVLRDDFDEQRHRRNAANLSIPWSVYAPALARSPHMTREQLEGAASILDTLANTIVQLVYRNEQLERELADTGDRTGQRRALIRRAITWMQQHLEEDIDVAQVARAVALSPPYFCALFTEHAGRNPRDYLIDLRLERAKDYLANSSLSVLEICAALGYTPNYFSRLFKERVGEPPSQFARRLRAKS